MFLFLPSAIGEDILSNEKKYPIFFENWSDFVFNKSVYHSRSFLSRCLYHLPNYRGGNAYPGVFSKNRLDLEARI